MRICIHVCINPIDPSQPRTLDGWRWMPAVWLLYSRYIDRHFLILIPCFVFVFGFLFLFRFSFRPAAFFFFLLPTPRPSAPHPLSYFFYHRSKKYLFIISSYFLLLLVLLLLLLLLLLLVLLLHLVDGIFSLSLFLSFSLSLFLSFSLQAFHLFFYFFFVGCVLFELILRLSFIRGSSHLS